MFLAVFTPISVHDFIINNFDFIDPGGFFGFSLADWEVTWVFSVILLSGVVFGTLGRKIDYFLIGILTLFGIYDYSVPISSPKMYLVLALAIVAGNIIGFTLKLLRHRFLPNWKV